MCSFSRNFAKLCGPPGFRQNVLDSFSCFYIIAYSNFTFCGAYTLTFLEHHTISAKRAYPCYHNGSQWYIWIFFDLGSTHMKRTREAETEFPYQCLTSCKIKSFEEKIEPFCVRVHSHWAIAKNEWHCFTLTISHMGFTLTQTNDSETIQSPTADVQCERASSDFVITFAWCDLTLTHPIAQK